MNSLLFLAASLWISLTLASANADDAGPTGLSIEPIEFVSNVPARTDRAKPVSPAIPSTPCGIAVFSADSKMVATVVQAGDDELKGDVVIWDVAAAKVRCKYTQPRRIATVAFSPDNSLLAIGPDGPQPGVTLIDTTSGEVRLTLDGPAMRTNCFAWSTDGSRLALGSSTDKSVREWSVARKRFVKAHEVELTQILTVAFTDDNKLLAAGFVSREKTQILVLDATTGKVLQTLAGHKEAIDAAQFNAKATQIASVGWDAAVRVWEVATGNSLAELKGHKRGINSVSWSQDGKRLVSANPREFKLWDGEKKELLVDLGGENSGARLVTMSPDGKLVVAISREGNAQLWDVEKKSSVMTFDLSTTPVAKQKSGSGNDAPAATVISDGSEPEAIQALAYSRDGKWLAIAREDGRITLRRAADGKVHRDLAAFEDVAASVAFSPDSRLLASGSFEKLIKIWNVESGELVAQLSGHTNWVFAVAFSPDSKMLASASYDKTIKLWSLDGKELATLSGHTAGVRAVAFMPNGKHLISGSSDRTAIVWNVETRQQVMTLKGHTAAVRDVACSPDGITVATASEDSTIKLWKAEDWTERTVAQGADGVMFWCVAFSPQGRTLAGGTFDGNVKLFDPSDGKERSTLTGPTDAITSVAFAPDCHEIIAGSVDKSYRRWKARQKGTPAIASVPSTVEIKPAEAKPTVVKTTEAVTDLKAITLQVELPVLSLDLDKSGKFIAIGTGGYRAAGDLQLWDLAKQTRKWKGAEFKFGLPAVAFSSNDQIAVGNFTDNFLRLYNVTNGEKIKEVRGHRSKVHGIAFAPNGKSFATASLDRDVKLWDATTNREIRTFVGHKDYAFTVEFSPDGKQLLSASADQTVRIWNVETGKEVRQLIGHGGMVQQATFSRDGIYVATASADGTSRIYETTTGDYLFTLRGHRNKLETVAFAPHGKLMATGSSDRTIRIWDARCGAELLTLNNEGVVRVVRFTPDGKQLISGGDDKTVKIWDVTGIGSK